MKKRILIAMFALSLAPLAHADAPAAAAAAAADAPVQNADGRATLDQRVDALEKDLAALSAQGGAPVSIYADPVRGLRFANADGTYGIQFSGLLQEDSRTYLYDGVDNEKGLVTQQPNEFVNARSRLIIDAFLGPRVKARYQEDFSNNGNGAILLDAYGELKLASWALLRAGQFKDPLDIERWRITPALDFIQYGYTAGLVVDRSQGALLEIADSRQVFYLSGGAVDGDTDAGSTPVVQAYNSDKDAVAKLFLQPLRALDGQTLGNLGLGVAGSAGNHSGDPEQSYKSEGQLTIVSLGGGNAAASAVEGASYRVIPQAYWYWKGLSLLGEYVHESQGFRLATTRQNEIADNEAWQAQAGWVLTGENAGYDGLKLNKDSGSWGALQLVARVQGAEYNEGAYSAYGPTGSVLSKGLADPETSVESLKSWSAGINYVPVSGVKLLADLDQTSFTGGGAILSSAGKVVLSNRPAEQILQVRAQFSF